MSSFLYYIIAATPSSSLYQLSYQLVLAFFGAEVLYVICKSNKQFILIFGSQEKTTYRITPFQIWWWGSKKSILIFYKNKPLEELQVKG